MIFTKVISGNENLMSIQSAIHTTEQLLINTMNLSNFEYLDNFDHGHRHTKDLLRLAIELATKLKVVNDIDWEIITATAVIHDLFADIDKTQHAQLSVNLFETISVKFFSPKQIEKIKEAVLLHEEKTELGKPKRMAASLEAQIFYDIDNLDAFGNKGFFRYVAIYYKRKNPLAEIYDNAKSRYKNLIFAESKNMGKSALNTLLKLAEGLTDKIKDPQDYRVKIVNFIAGQLDLGISSPLIISEKALNYFNQPSDQNIYQYFSDLIQEYT